MACELVQILATNISVGLVGRDRRARRATAIRRISAPDFEVR